MLDDAPPREVRIADPLLVHVTKDDELSGFEKKTIRYGIGGVIVASLALLAASITAYFIYQQFTEMSAQTDLANKAAKYAREESKNSGIAAEKQIRVLQRQLELQQQTLDTTQRAWIGVGSNAFSYGTNKEGIPTASALIAFINVGHSPAFKIHEWRCGEVSDREPVVDKPRASLHCEDSELGTLGVGSYAQLETTDSTKATPNKSLALGSGDAGKHLYVWGIITYDILSGDKRHFLKFCLKNSGNGMAPCSKGNDAD